MSSEMRGIICVILSAASLSTMGIFGLLAFQYGVEPINLVTLRAILAFIILTLGLFFIRGRLPRLHIQHLFAFVALGMFGIALNYASFFLALSKTSVSVAITLLYTYPILVVMGAIIFLGEKLTVSKSIVIVMTFVGCVFITEAYQTSIANLPILGIFWAFMASLTKAFYTLLSKFLLRHYDPWQMTFFAFGFGSIFLLIYSIASSQLTLKIGIPAWYVILAIAIIPSLIGYTLFVLALKFLESGKASLIATIEPVCAILLAYFFFDETITMAQVFGISLIVGGIIFLNTARN